MSLRPTKRFSKHAEYYAKYRPGYPAEVLAILRREIGFDSRAVVADVGSGTGILTKVFLQNGNRVFAVEPNDDMRSYAERDFAGFKGYVSVKGTAERTTLPDGSVDLVTVGQALHWFDPPRAAREFSRVSKEGGHLCVAHNVRTMDAPFMSAYRSLIRRNERRLADAPDVDGAYVSRFFKGRRFSRFSAPNEQVLDYAGLVGRLASASYMPTPSEGKRYERFVKEARKLFDAYESDGKVKLLYRTNVFVGEV